MDASDLRLFAAVARTGGIGKAALELNTVQSNVTARLKALEDRLGTVLFCVVTPKQAGGHSCVHC
jgi:LysR family transcriptional regulator, cell division regulator